MTAGDEGFRFDLAFQEVGGDVVAVAPPFDQSGNTALVGATMMFEILCPLAEAVAAWQGGDCYERN